MDPAWIALIGTVCGGVGLKVIEHWLGRNKIRSDDATQIRDELRLEITTQREEIKQLEAEVEKWRGEYYKLLQTYILQQQELARSISQIKDEAIRAEMQAKLSEVPPPQLSP